MLVDSYAATYWTGGDGYTLHSTGGGAEVRRQIIRRRVIELIRKRNYGGISAERSGAGTGPVD